MAGIYIHIPFCKQACHYCNFHFSLSLSKKNELLDALLLEIDQRKNYLQPQEIKTIYFGGGTPSLLDYDDLSRIRDKIHSSFKSVNVIEFTLEANPDDLTQKKIDEIRKVGVNRLSIGVQSFHDVDLIYMNRAHTSSEALSCIQRCQDSGIDNLSVDLIYGTPTMTDEQWLDNLQRAVNTKVPHLSAYALTVEPKTKLHSLIKKQMTEPVVDDHSLNQFNLLVDFLESKQYEQYEISNFCKDKRYSAHNTSYWMGTHYLGFGPSAHSFNGHSRSWNISNNVQYVRRINQGDEYSETEQLTFSNQVNEYILTSLRTVWGTDLNKVQQKFGGEARQSILVQLKKNVSSEYYYISDDTIYLTKAGKFMADGISSALFLNDLPK